jgi:hypothetical protein
MNIVSKDEEISEMLKDRSKLISSLKILAGEDNNGLSESVINQINLLKV